MKKGRGGGRLRIGGRGKVRGKEVTCLGKSCRGKWRKAGKQIGLVRKLGVGKRKKEI